MKITVPTIILSEKVARRNIDRMIAKAAHAGIALRPHFKTHQSATIGSWFREKGVTRCTVSSLKMAEYFAANEWDDITVAFPVNILETERINRLAKHIKLNLLIEDAAVASFLAENLTHNVAAWIKIDCGYHRTGIAPTHTPRIKKLIEAIEASPKMNFAGFLTHNGASYQCRGKNEIFESHTKALNNTLTLKETFPEACISYGDTPSCSAASDFEGIDEMRPGNFVFYDAMQVQIGSCTFDDIAVKIACPVVAVHPERGEAVIYGGGIHLSKDFLVNTAKEHVYGIICEINGHPVTPGFEKNIVTNVSQEHGIIKTEPSILKQLKPGNLITLYPVHSCMTANLLKSYITTEGKKIAMMP